MTHPLTPYRDQIDAIIGPLEEQAAKLEAIQQAATDAGISARATGSLYFVGLNASIEHLQELVNFIDTYEPEDEEPEVEEPEEEDEPEEEEEDDDA